MASILDEFKEEEPECLDGFFTKQQRLRWRADLAARDGTIWKYTDGLIDEEERFKGPLRRERVEVSCHACRRVLCAMWTLGGLHPIGGLCDGCQREGRGP